MLCGPIRFDFELMIDEVSCVHVPGEPAALRSYWQVPDISATTFSKGNWSKAPGAKIVPRGDQ